MIKRIIIALLSTAIFGLLMGFLNYVPMSEREPNVGYSPMWVPMMFYTMYSIPVYLVGGISSSYLIDKLVAQRTFHSKLKLYLMKFALYGIFGIVAAFIYIMILAIAEGETYLIPGSMLNYLTLGLVASLIFYHVSLIVRKK